MPGRGRSAFEQMLDSGGGRLAARMGGGKRTSGCVALLGLLLVTTCGALGETPQGVTPCALKADPSTYDHRLVEVSGFVSHGMEDFSLIDPSCLSGTGLWLEYGGTVGSGTTYCCGVSADRRRPKPPTVEGVRLRLGQ